MKSKCQEPIKNKFRPSSFEYQNIEEEFKTQPDWPPISASTNNLAELMRLESAVSGATADDIDLEEDDEDRKVRPGLDSGDTLQQLQGNGRVPGDGDSGDHSPSQLDSPPLSPKDDKTPLLVDSSGSQQTQGADRRVPLLDPIQMDAASPLSKASSLDTSPLVDHELSQHALAANHQTTAL